MNAAPDARQVGGQVASRRGWETRLLRSPLAPLYRAAVAVCARTMLAYVAHAPSWLPREAIWQRIGYYYLFPRGYTALARTEFDATIECNMKDVIQRSIMFFGVWEPNLTAFLWRRLKAGDVFIDLGANVGYFTLLASKLVGETGAVVAVEAAPDIFRALQNNLARNGMKNVRAVEVAVAAAPGSVQLYWDGDGNLGATTMVPTRGYVALTEVAATSLEHIVTSEELSRTRIIKIDLEGAELPPLRTLLSLAAALRPDAEIVVELVPASIDVPEDGEGGIIGAFRRAGYHAYDLGNSYAITGCFERRAAAPPRRIVGPIIRQTDVVFSRIESNVL